MNRRFQFVIVTASTCLLIVLLLGSFLGRSSAAEDAYSHFKVFTEVISRIKSEYVEEPEMKNVTLGALNGMLESIDPFASYLNADQYKQYLRSRETKQADVGLLLARRYGYVGVVESIPGSPAAILGLTTGDVLETINDVSTRDMPLAYAEMLLQGDRGTKLDMTVLRVRRGAEAQRISLVRAPIAYPPVASKLLPDEVGYLQIATLESGKIKEVSTHLGSLHKQGAKRLVLDLRGNANGSPEDGVALADLFLEKGLITYLEGQRVTRQNFQSDPAKTLWKLPLVVVTNRGTAGGAEVAAAALLDNKRAEVVGERTYGNAAQRKPVTMEDGGAVILSVAKYYSPAGKAIQDVGVTPSVAVVTAESQSEGEEDAPPVVEPPAPAPDQDQTLKKAIEVLTIGVAASKENDRKRTDQAKGPPEPDRLLTPLGIPRRPNQ
jgi:carboxyl-terminal processing protease